MKHLFYWYPVFVIVAFLPMTAFTQQRLIGHVPAAARSLKPISRMRPDSVLTLTIGLPLRDRGTLQTMLQQIYDPRSVAFRHFITPQHFAELFGPTRATYQSLINYCRKNGFTIRSTTTDNTLLYVSAPVSRIERAFSVNLFQYRRIAGPDTILFRAPDREPVLKLGTPVLFISNLNDYSAALSRKKLSGRAAMAPKTQNYLASDFRNAYAPGVTLTGAGQTVAIIMFQHGFDPSDIVSFQAELGIPSIPVNSVPLDGSVPPVDGFSQEITTDIEMAMGIAPGLSQVRVYFSEDQLTSLKAVATENIAKQISASINPPPEDDNATQVYEQFALQGQTFFVSSGDAGSYYPTVPFFADHPMITVVGGTVLTTGTGGSYSSETTWHDNFGSSGGGSKLDFPIPSWQQEIDMTANFGSTKFRNSPDISISAETDDFFKGAQSGFTGTSVSAPLWAGYCALINQYANSIGRTTMGWLNPSIYRLGISTFRDQYYHDVTTGNNLTKWNMTPGNANQYFAVPGYDLCTGWGSPAGMPLIQALAGQQFTDVSPALTGAGNEIYFFAKTMDRKIVYNHAVLGQAGTTWTDVEGNGVTNFSPAAAAVGSHIFVAITGMDGQIQINQADVDGFFGSWQGTGAKSNVPPALAGVGNSIYFFATDPSNKIMFSKAVLGQAGTAWSEVNGGGSTTKSPAAAAVNNHIFLAIAGNDGHMWVNQADLDQPFGNWIQTDGLTDETPAVVAVGDNVYFFIKSPAGKIMFSRAQIGQAGTPWQEVEGNGFTMRAPAAGAVGQHVFVSITTPGTLIMTNQADLGMPFSVWF